MEKYKTNHVPQEAQHIITWHYLKEKSSLLEIKIAVGGKHLNEAE